MATSSSWRALYYFIFVTGLWGVMETECPPKCSCNIKYLQNGSSSIVAECKEISKDDLSHLMNLPEDINELIVSGRYLQINFSDFPTHLKNIVTIAI